MPIGNPLLATWAEDDLIRTYEYVSGVFVPLGVSSAIVNAPLSTDATDTENTDPGLRWVQSDQYLLVEHAPSGVNAAQAIKVLAQDASQVSTLASDAGTNIAGGIYVDLKDQETFLYRPSGYVGSSEAVRVDVDGLASRSTFSQGPTRGSTAVSDMAVSADGLYVMSAGLGGSDGLRVSKRSSLGDWPPGFGTTDTLATTEIDPELVMISGDNATILLGSIDNNLLQCWTYDGTSMLKVHDVALPPDSDLKRIVGSPDGRYVAVAVFGTTWTTRILRRQSGFFIFVTDIGEFGESLAWSIDGILLMDAAAKKCVIRDGDDFSDHDSAMINIADDILSAKFSNAPVYKSAIATVYIGALEQIANDTLDLANIKFTLLSSSAVFDETDTTFVQATNTGAYEISGGAWPDGGLVLDNVSAALDTPTFDWTADPLVWLAFGSAMTWRYGLLYDATSLQPLVFLDYYGERTVAAGRELHFPFADDVFLKLTR